MWPFRPKLTPKTPSAEIRLAPQKPDAPIAFGFKITWWSLPTVDTEAVARHIGLQNLQRANVTPEERKLGFAFFDERSPEANDDSYWEREDLTFPNEMNVMDIAREWSICPCDLDEFQAEEHLLGVLGSHSELLKYHGE